MQRSFRIIIGWMKDSAADCGDSQIENRETLIEYGDRYYFSLLDIKGDTMPIAYGKSIAFDHDFTATDTISVVQELVNGEWIDIGG
jgi:hypothetical protein